MDFMATSIRLCDRKYKSKKCRKKIKTQSSDGKKKDSCVYAYIHRDSLLDKLSDKETEIERQLYYLID